MDCSCNSITIICEIFVGCIFAERYDETMMINFIKSLSKEERQKLMQEFMNSMSDEEKTEMIQEMMPIMMKNMKPSMMMESMMKNFNENDCKKMMSEMSSETREKCRMMMTTCLRILQEIEKTTE